MLIIHYFSARLLKNNTNAVIVYFDEEKKHELCFPKDSWYTK